MTWLEVVTFVITLGTFLYLVALQTISLSLMVAGALTVRGYILRRPMRNYREVAESPLSLAVTLMVPAHNEEATIVDSIRALLASDFATFEVVIVNDGSSDDTLKRLVAGFDLVPFGRAPRSGLTCAELKATYASRLDDRVFVVDKENAGKADALNAALNYARYPLVCALDADTLLDHQALASLVWEFQTHPETVAVGGIVRVANGSVFDGIQLSTVRTPSTLLPNMQIMEYLRVFLGARIGWSRFNLLIIISGAFGLFRRDAIVDVGGYDTRTVGEDAELVLRLHRRALEEDREYRITFSPDPICWTEVPSSMKILSRQRDRWQRGLGQMLWLHKDMFFRPRYKGIGRVALPYFLLFEFFGPLVGVFGYAFMIFAILTGLINPAVAVWFFILAVLSGIAMSYFVVIIEQHTYRRYPSWRDMAWLCASAVLENLGYRQYLALIRCKAILFTFGKHGRSWGEMTREGFSQSAESKPANEQPSESKLLRSRRNSSGADGPAK